MISDRELDANEVKSSSPKTSPGYAAMRANAFGYRPTATEIILPPIEDELDIIKEDIPTLAPQDQLALIVLNDAQYADTLGKRSRYETRFERFFYRPFQQVQLLQALPQSKTARLRPGVN